MGIHIEFTGARNLVTKYKIYVLIAAILFPAWAFGSMEYRGAPQIQASEKNRYLSLINKARKKSRSCGTRGYFYATSSLKWSDNLYRSSYTHSHDMATHNHFSHRGSKGSNFKDRIEKNGYKNWRKIAENIAMGYKTPEKTIQKLLASDHHCANIMNPKFTEFGMALSRGKRYYWTQDFGTR